MQHDIPDLDRAGLRKFGLTTGAILAVLFGLFFPWLFERPIPLWPWIVAGVLVAWALAAPGTLGPVYRGWMRFGLFMSKIMNPIVMGLMFYIVITPVGLARRLMAKDSLSRSFDDAKTTYRIDRAGKAPSGLKNPY